MTDYTDLKIPVFANINDQPVIPTATKAGNGSNLIATINDLLDRLTAQPAASNSNWNVITASTQLQVNSKNLMTIGENNDTSIVLTLPANIVTGNYVTLLKAHEALTCEIAVYPQIRGYGSSTVTLEAIYEEVTLVYLDSNQGWIMSRNGVLNFVLNPQ